MSNAQEIKDLFNKYVVPTYGRFDLTFSHGKGSYLWDLDGKKYLDLGTGIAVCSLGHANLEITETLIEQSKKLIHVSNLYYTEPQGQLAKKLVEEIAPGKVFFCNSGAEANEGLYKLARKSAGDGRFEIITTINSFHGRTLAGIAATGQAKVKSGFEPMVPGFKHVPYNDLAAIENAITAQTAAVLIEGIQGEGGITLATPEYLLGLRKICDQKNILLMMDGVQCGYFRTGCFQSFQRILEGDLSGFLPDAISMAKAIGTGFPLAAFWVGTKHADVLGAGSHGTTYGGTPLACAVALKVLEVIKRDKLADNARTLGAYLKSGLENLQTEFPQIIKTVRGIGLMIGLEIADKDLVLAFKNSDKPAAIQMVNLLHTAGLITIPSGNQVIRFLPALNVSKSEIDLGLQILKQVLEKLS